MKAIMLMFDTLNRHMLPPYGCDWTHAPNFARLAEKTVTFDKAYIGSMPCMPARRELHTGRYNFLHRSWGPLEPFDDSMPEILKNNGVYTHLITDHYHYVEDGGATYHHRYNTWEMFRGQEGDKWFGQVEDPDIPDHLGNFWRQDVINRQQMPTEALQPQAQTFAAGLEFIQRNHQQDKWFLQIETFDPHEPFFTQQQYKDLYPHDYDGAHFDHPQYRAVTETPEQVQHVRYEYTALLSMCDTYLGKVLDLMDDLNLWDDTLLIINTDHGFLLGEHDWWAKMKQPFYQEVAHMPLFIWDPRSKQRGIRRDQLVQSIDLPATLLEFFEVECPKDMQGIPLGDCIANNTPTREAILFGMFGGHVNVTDGQYIYMRAPVHDDNHPINNYTLMPTHMNHRFRVEELQDLELAEPFSFTKGCRLLKVKGRGKPNNIWHGFGTLLFDVQNDPEQSSPLGDEAIEARMIDLMIPLMQANDCPHEQFERLGLTEKVNTNG